MPALRRLFSLLAVALAIPAASASTGSLVKHTVSGTGTFEQGRGLRAEVTRATFHPIDQHFALSVSGRMGWVITGQWEREGNAVTLVVANMNNTPARGSGELKLDARGNVETVKLSGSTRGGAYKVRFRAGAPAPAAPPSVRLGPGTHSERDTFDRTRHGTGALTFSGQTPITLDSATVEISGSGRVTVRAHGGGTAYHFEGTAGSSGEREEIDLVLHAIGGTSGVVTGAARMDRSGRANEHLRLQGWMGTRPFQLDFRARR